MLSAAAALAGGAAAAAADATGGGDAAADPAPGAVLQHPAGAVPQVAGSPRGKGSRELRRLLKDQARPCGIQAESPPAPPHLLQ